MSTTLVGMAKRKQNGEDSKGTDTVRVESDLAHKITVIAINRGVSVANLLSPQLRKWVESEYRKVVKETYEKEFGASGN